MDRWTDGAILRRPHSNIHITKEKYNTCKLVEINADKKI